MSIYNKGNVFKIAAMASKSCNAVSARDLFTPLTATVITDTANRTFRVEVVATCYFGTRINIENVFHDMYLNDQPVPNKTIDSWVSGDEPGKQIATLTLNGTYNAEGIPSTRQFSIPFSGKMTYYKDVGCTKTAEMPFSNEVKVVIENIEPNYTQPAKPTITNVTSLDDALLIDVETTSFGEGGGKYLYVEASKTSDFANAKVSESIDTLTGRCRISNLQINTRYYVRAVCANNGLSTNGDAQQNETLAASEITSINYVSSLTNGRIDILVYNGSGANSVSTDFQISYDEGRTWITIQTSASTSTFSVSISLSSGTLYRTRTTTAAGSYESAPVEFYPTYGIGAVLESIEQNGGTSVIANYRIIRTNSGDVTARLYYRPYGIEEEWVLATTQVIPSSSSTFSATINGLIPNYADYEVSLNLVQEFEEIKNFTYNLSGGVTASIDWDQFYKYSSGRFGTYQLFDYSTAGDSWNVTYGGRTGRVSNSGLGISFSGGKPSAGDTITIEYQSTLEADTPAAKFFTVPVTIRNDTCETLDYMVQLICQTYNAIKQGNITIYMNDDTKKWCEGEDGIPTLAAIMSRINRFMHSVGCVLCSMDGFIELLKDSTANQIYMAKLGWVDFDDEPIQGSVKPASSGGIYDAIDELIHQVWHYIGDYDYFGKDLADLQSQTPAESGATGVVNDKIYTWNGSSWVESEDFPYEDFGVIHINDGKYAEHAYYWFVDKWNRLDADTDALEERLDELESLDGVENLDVTEYKIALVAETGTYSGTETSINTLVPTDAERDTVVIITQPERQDETHLAVYDDGDGNPIP